MGNGQDATQRRQAHETADRIFGVPSIRTDRQPPRRMPVDNVTNYGDPTTSRTLLIPDRYTLQGIPDRELSRDRSLEDIAQLMSAAEIRVGSDTLESAYATVAANHNGHVSLRSLLHQLNTSGRQKKSSLSTIRRVPSCKHPISGNALTHKAPTIKHSL